jgi:hypothetical protein
MFLMGLPDEEIIKAEIPANDFQKCKQFQQCMLKGHTFYGSGKAIGIPEHISKTMREMFEQWKSGSEITFGVPSREKCPHIASAFELLLSGASESEMREMCTEFEIKKAKLFAQIASSDKLYAAISKETGLAVSTVKKLRKIYRDSQGPVSSPQQVPHLCTVEPA